MENPPGLSRAREGHTFTGHSDIAPNIARAHDVAARAAKPNIARARAPNIAVGGASRDVARVRAHKVAARIATRTLPTELCARAALHAWRPLHRRRRLSVIGAEG